MTASAPTAGQRAKAHFAAGFNCAESVFLAGAEALGKSEPGVIPAIATTFGGGMHLDGFCGALTGALMAIGLAVGRQDAADQAKKDMGTKLGMDFGARFKEANGGKMLCSEFTLHHFTVAEEFARWRAGTGRQTICTPLVENTADQVVAFLRDQGLLGREG